MRSQERYGAVTDGRYAKPTARAWWDATLDCEGGKICSVWGATWHGRLLWVRPSARTAVSASTGLS